MHDDVDALHHRRRVLRQVGQCDAVQYRCVRRGARQFRLPLDVARVGAQDARGGGPNNDPIQTHGLLASIQAIPSFATSGIINGGSALAGPLAPNTWAAVKGNGLSATTGTWIVTGSTLPTTLNGVSVTVNGEPIIGVQSGKYLAIRRLWSANDTIELSFDMTTHLLKANPAVNEDRGRVAFQRGPIVFCMEHPDQEDTSGRTSVFDYTARLNEATTSRYDANLLDGVMVLEHPGTISRPPADLGLYFSSSEPVKAEEIPAKLRLIPYYAWANRGPAAMQVWIPYKQA